MFDSIVEAVFHYASVKPDQLCLADDTSQVSYREYADLILGYASCFSEMGFGRSDKIVVEACQSIDYLAIQLALQLIGAVFVPVEHNCAATKIASFAERVDAAAVITCRENDFSPARSLVFEQLSRLCSAAPVFELASFPARGDVCEILFSTGTTGREKGIVLTHGNNIALAENVISGVEMEKDNIEVIPSPLNHSHGLRRYYANMYNGSAVLLLGNIMNIPRFFELLDSFHANSMDLVPAALAILLKLTKDALARYRGQIRYIQFGAAPMMKADQDRICALLPDTRLYNFYGSTESGCICIFNFNRPDEKKNCIGKPTCNADIVIVDDERLPIRSSADNPGLLSSRGSMNMLGYWKDKDETEKVLSDGVVYSNDIAYFDEDGDIILLGRKGDVINVGGKKVSPEEIENVVKMLPAVADCGVVPVSDPFKGSVPKPFVQIKSGSAFDPIAIRSFLAGQLEPFKIPDIIVEIEKIPRSFNGKLLRKELK